MQMKRNTTLIGVCIATIAMTTQPGWSAAQRQPIQQSEVQRVSVKPPVTDRPGGLAPGGSRTQDCLGQGSLTPPTADSNAANLRFRVPQTQAKTAVFVLQNDRRQQVYQSTQLIQDNGTVTVNLPPIEPGKSYRWIFSVVCNAELPDANPALLGQIKR